MACSFQLAMDLKIDSMERDVQKSLGGGAAKTLRYSHEVTPTFSFSLEWNTPLQLLRE